MPISGPELIAKLRGTRTRRGKINLYLDHDLYKQFQEVCAAKDIAASKMIEELMRGLLNDIQGKAPSDPVTLLRTIFPSLNEKQARHLVEEIDSLTRQKGTVSEPLKKAESRR